MAATAPVEAAAFLDEVAAVVAKATKAKAASREERALMHLHTPAKLTLRAALATADAAEPAAYSIFRY